MVPGVCSENAKPIFLYAGGSWLSESAKVPRFDTNGKVVHVCVCVNNYCNIHWLVLFNTRMKQQCFSSSTKAQEFLSKAANADKAIEFRVSSGEDMVSLLEMFGSTFSLGSCLRVCLFDCLFMCLFICLFVCVCVFCLLGLLFVSNCYLLCDTVIQVVLEEQTSQGAADSQPMSLYALMVSMEKKGHLDTKLTGHLVDRPPAVKRGEDRDHIQVTHEAFSVFRPNAVNVKSAKSTNMAGLIGNKVLSASAHLQLVWRSSGCQFSCLIFG